MNLISCLETLVVQKSKAPSENSQVIGSLTLVAFSSNRFAKSSFMKLAVAHVSTMAETQLVPFKQSIKNNSRGSTYDLLGRNMTNNSFSKGSLGSTLLGSMVGLT